MSPQEPLELAEDLDLGGQAEADTDLGTLEALAVRVVELIDECAAGHPEAGEVEANVVVARGRHGLTRFANSFIHQHVIDDTVHVVVTLAAGGRTASATTTTLDEERLRALVDETIVSATLQPVDPHWPGATPPVDAGADRTGDAETAEPGDLETARGDPASRAAGVKAFIDAGDGLQAAGYLDTEARWVAFASTAGHRVSGWATRATIDGIQQDVDRAGSAHQSARRLADLDPASAGALATHRVRRAPAMVDVDPGVYEVVLQPEAVATILTFLAAYGFNAKVHLEGGSFARLGEPQFDPRITIVEDPTDARTLGLPFDTEGVARHRYHLVDGGITSALAHDRRTARRTGTTTTGNAVPGGEGFGPVPTSIVLAPGDRSPDELVASMTRGLLVTQFHYCRILDPKSQVVTGLTRNGTFLVEDGEVVATVGNLRFTQSFVDGLGPGAVLGVGSDNRHAANDLGFGGVICPSLHLARWSFTGSSRA